MQKLRPEHFYEPILRGRVEASEKMRLVAKTTRSQRR